MNDLVRLEKAADRQEITDLIYRYCRAMDRMDHEQGYAIWHEDGTADYGPDVFQGTGRGFIDWVCESHKHLDAHSHQVTNIVIELDGDTAGSEAYVIANLRQMDGERLINRMFSARYIDTWSKRSGRWAIDRRDCVVDFSEEREVTSLGNDPRSARDASDPSNSVLKAVP